MKLVDAPATRSFAALAALTLASFAIAVIAEDAINAMGSHVESTRAEIAMQERILRLPGALAGTSRAMESRIADLHLAVSGGAQAAILIGALERVSARYDLKIMTFRRVGATVADARISTNFEREPYEIVVEGTYPHVLGAIVALCRAPLVMQIPLVTFERAPGGVRASIQLQLFRLQVSNVRS